MQGSCTPASGAAVRQAQGGDLLWMAALWLQMMQRHSDAHPRFTLADDAGATWEASIWDMMARPDSFVYVVPDVGFCCGWVARHPAIYRAQKVGLLSEIVVAQQARRQGVGTALMQAARSWFISREVQEYQLATAMFNDSAQRFFAAQGGTPLLMRYHFALKG